MAARTGEEFLRGLRENPPQLYLQGERVKDPTTHGGLRNGVHTLARLYDMQHEPELRDVMTYLSPSSGDRVGLSFIAPRTQSELQRRSAMMTQWAKVSCGMMGRTPDFLNVSFMAMAEASGYFAGNRPEFGKNIRSYYEFIRENDLVLTHTLINLQRSRQPSQSGLDDTTDVALSVVKETDEGIVVHGARVLATLPIADEIAVYPPRSHHLPADAARRTSFAFALPCHAPGLKFLCRESFDLQRTRFDHPLGSRFEEMDAIAFFDNVLVPWERVFLFGDVDLCNNMSMATGQYVHSGHQVVAKNVVKCEFILGLANLMVQTLGSGQLPQVQQMLAEIIENLEVTKACLRTAEVDAKVDAWGVMSPAPTPLMVARQLFIRMYPRMAEILHLLGSSSLMALPTEADFRGPLAPEIRRYLETDTASAEERVRLFRLAWDTCCSAFASRQVLYERFFQGDQVRNAFLLNALYDKQPMTERVRAILEG
ncbi:MAG: 4-hydroxyphenylacetate 3-monooxygenase, oxygenase component [Candidatus Tectomicrobia bacterium]|nr:4-hydroxyphenylacetate 3-monooxygenase, oxygenase component [Candidatus Tectomicrobia bacterium]